MQVRNESHIQGIDVSHYQGTIDWASVKGAGIQFAYVKASEGVTYTDPMFAQNVLGAKAVGIPVGAYHFARPNQTAAIDEVRHFVSLLQASPTDLFPVVDLEAPSQPGLLSPEQIVEWVKIFVQAVKQATGKQVILYTGNWFAAIYNNFNNQLADLPLWVSNYGNEVPDFGGWSEWTLWQYSSTGNVPGINGAVDMDIAVSLETLGYQPPKPIAAYLLSKEDANGIINRWIGHEYDFASVVDQLERHRLANELRKASGQEVQN